MKYFTNSVAEIRIWEKEFNKFEWQIRKVKRLSEKETRVLRNTIKVKGTLNGKQMVS